MVLLTILFDSLHRPRNGVDSSTHFTTAIAVFIKQLATQNFRMTTAYNRLNGYTLVSS